jgi:hypothetical protein
MDEERRDEEHADEGPRARFRHLPPRITPAEIIETQPVFRAFPEDGWTPDEREIQGGRAG